MERSLEAVFGTVLAVDALVLSLQTGNWFLGLMVISAGAMLVTDALFCWMGLAN